jgi:hypothetical protein
MSRPSHPEPPTVADLEKHGPAVCLAVLREEFTEHHKRFDQYRGWTEGTVLGVACQQIGGHGTFVRAEAGDLLLVKRDRHRPWAGCRPDDVAYAPRIGWNVAIFYSRVEDVPIPEC